jgi:septal ring factor EnvC (AmiA/AmiB activator)
MMADALADMGVSEKSTKAQLYAAATKLASKLQSAERKLQKEQEKATAEKADALTTLEERIRARTSTSRSIDVQNVIITATVAEITEAAEFFDDFKDLQDHLPVAVQRLIVGVDTLLGRNSEEASSDASAAA